jgi:hypothetical protein
MGISDKAKGSDPHGFDIKSGYGYGLKIRVDIKNILCFNWGSRVSHSLGRIGSKQCGSSYQ